MALRLSTEYNGVDGDSVVCLVDSVTEWAFGPIFYTEAEAGRFLDYAEHCGVSDGDVRQLDNIELEKLYGEYQTELAKARKHSDS